MNNEIDLKKLNDDYICWLNNNFDLIFENRENLQKLFFYVGENNNENYSLYVYFGNMKEIDGVWGITPFVDSNFIPAINLAKFYSDLNKKEFKFRIVAISNKIDLQNYEKCDDLIYLENGFSLTYFSKDLNIYGWLDFMKKNLKDYYLENDKIDKEV